jgi:hypothetical protein
MLQKRIALEIESIFKELQMGKSAYSKGEFFQDHFFIRSNLALVVLNKDNEIMVSFADHTLPSHAALYALLLDDIESSALCICENYKTDSDGSMIMDEEDFNSTQKVIWDDKSQYYNMLKDKVKPVIARRNK